jgi:hypothetical protein
MPQPEEPATPTLGAEPEVAPDMSYERALRAELDRRVAALAASSDEDFGRLGRGDGILIVALFVLLPAFAAWLCR